MTEVFETKFSIGDTVWIENLGKPFLCTVAAVRGFFLTQRTDRGNLKTTYNVGYYLMSEYSETTNDREEPAFVDETLLFATEDSCKNDILQKQMMLSSRSLYARL